jgi:hypothetical protein
MEKFKAKIHPKAEILMKRSPKRSSDLWLNRTLHAPMNTAVIAARIEAAVRI